MAIGKITEPDDLAAVAEIVQQLAELAMLLVEAGCTPDIAVRALALAACKVADEQHVTRAVIVAIVQKISRMPGSEPC